MSFLRVLSLVVPLRRETPPSAVAVLRDPEHENDTLMRLACVVNNSLMFVHSVALYTLRTMVLLTQEYSPLREPILSPLHVSIVVIPSRHGNTPSVSVIADLHIEHALNAQRRHTYWCWQLASLVELSWGPPTNPALHSIHNNNSDDGNLVEILHCRMRTPYSAALPWYQRNDAACWVQGGEILLRPPRDARGVVVRGGDRSLVLHHVSQLQTAGQILVVAPSPVLTFWWRCATAHDHRFVCRVAHDMLHASVLTEQYGMVVWDAAQPFPLHCTINRPDVMFNLVLAPAECGVTNTRAEHALCRLLGMPQVQIQSLLLPPASMVVHRAETYDSVETVRVRHVTVPDDLRHLMTHLRHGEAHAHALLHDLPNVLAQDHLRADMFGISLSSADAPSEIMDKNPTCPLCEIESRCNDYPLLMLPGCQHTICMQHFQRWSHQCAMCRCENTHALHELPVVRRTGSMVHACGGGVMPVNLTRQLQDAVTQHWDNGRLPPLQQLCVDTVCARCEDDARIVVLVAEHDAAVLAMAENLRQRGVCVQATLSPESTTTTPKNNSMLTGRNLRQTVLCISQRLVCSAARIGWLAPVELRHGSVHAVCATCTLPVMSVVKMLQGCGTGSSITFVCHADTPEQRSLRQRLDDFQQARGVDLAGIDIRVDNDVEHTAAHVV